MTAQKLTRKQIEAIDLRQQKMDRPDLDWAMDAIADLLDHIEATDAEAAAHTTHHGDRLCISQKQYDTDIREAKSQALREAANKAVTLDHGIPWTHDYDRATVASWLIEEAEDIK